MYIYVYVYVLHTDIGLRTTKHSPTVTYPNKVILQSLKKYLRPFYVLA